ncbi:hypothetical protein Emag_006026 [Eimeria magna]
MTPSATAAAAATRGPIRSSSSERTHQQQQQQHDPISSRSYISSCNTTHQQQQQQHDLSAATAKAAAKMHRDALRCEEGLQLGLDADRPLGVHVHPLQVYLRQKTEPQRDRERQK